MSLRTSVAATMRNSTFEVMWWKRKRTRSVTVSVLRSSGLPGDTAPVPLGRSGSSSESRKST